VYFVDLHNIITEPRLATIFMRDDRLDNIRFDRYLYIRFSFIEHGQMKLDRRHCLFLAWQPPQWARASSFTRFLDHTQRRTTVGRTHVDEWSARRRDLYLTTNNTHNTQTSMSPVGFKTHILSSRAAADLRLRLCGHWSRQTEDIKCLNALYGEFYVHVTVHRDKFPYNETNQMH
jgi:hypothetical protein